MEVEPYVSGRPFDQRPDWEYYARRVAQTLAYITEVYGWDEKALFTGTQPAQQKSLDSGDFAEHETPSEGPRRAEKKMTLEDYFCVVSWPRRTPCVDSAGGRVRTRCVSPMAICSARLADARPTTVWSSKN